LFNNGNSIHTDMISNIKFIIAVDFLILLGCEFGFTGLCILNPRFDGRPHTD